MRFSVTTFIGAKAPGGVQSQGLCATASHGWYAGLAMSRLAPAFQAALMRDPLMIGIYLFTAAVCGVLLFIFFS